MYLRVKNKIKRYRDNVFELNVEKSTGNNSSEIFISFPLPLKLREINLELVFECNDGLHMQQLIMCIAYRYFFIISPRWLHFKHYNKAKSIRNSISQYVVMSFV